jgi:hypothetical protein
MVVLYKKRGNTWDKMGMTEVIMDSLDPTWVKAFDVQYHFEKREYYKAEIYDVDDFNNLNNFANHDFVGRLEFEIHEVVTARHACLEKSLVNTDRAVNKSGTIKIMADEK